MYDPYDEASVPDLIIAFLNSGRSAYVARKILFERIQKRRKINKNSFNQGVYYLKKKGLLNKSNDAFSLNEKNLSQYLKYNFLSSKPIGSQKVILIFDIPESKRKTRNWLRNQIKIWGFKMIQQSVWMGDGPLPPDFNQRLKILEIDKNVKIFNVKKQA